MKKLNEEDILMITADHGNDPTFRGSDHTREQVPLLIYSPSFHDSKILEEQSTFGVIGATISDNFKIEYNGIGKSILKDLK